MESIKKTPEKIIFRIGLNESLANAIRRYVNQIQILAVDELEIKKNDSPLYDETIAHRVGLMPLKTGKNKSATFSLKSKKEGYVYSGEIEGSVKFVYDKIPLTYLNKGQELEFTATATTGTGSEHSKFSPGMISYRNSIEVIADKRILEKIKDILDSKQISEKGDKVIIKDNEEKEVADFIEGVCEKEGISCEEKIDDNLIVNIESFGQISPEEIFSKSIEVLKSDLEEFKKQLK